VDLHREKRLAVEWGGVSGAEAPGELPGTFFRKKEKAGGRSGCGVEAFQD